MAPESSSRKTWNAWPSASSSATASAMVIGRSFRRILSGSDERGPSAPSAAGMRTGETGFLRWVIFSLCLTTWRSILSSARSRADSASAPLSWALRTGARRPSRWTLMRQTVVVRPLRLRFSEKSTSSSATVPKWRTSRVSLRSAFSRTSCPRPLVRSCRTTFTTRVYDSRVRPAHRRSRAFSAEPGGRLVSRGLVAGGRREQHRDLLGKRDSLGEDAVQDFRPQAGRLELRDHLSVRGRALLLQHEDVLHGDDVLLHADDLGDRGHLARAIAQPVQLDDEVDAAAHLLANGPYGKVDAGHQNEGLEPGECVARGVGVQGRHRAVVAGVHGLKHVKRLAATALPDDDALRAHAQGVDDQPLDGDFALSVDVPWPGLEPADMLLVQLQLGRVLDRDDAVFHRDEAGQHVQERGLAVPGAARDDDVGLGKDGGLEKTEPSLVAAPEANEVFDLERVTGELADREQRTVQGERPDDRVDTAAICQAGITERLALVDAAADGAHDELDDVEQLVFIDELDVRQNDLTAHFDINMVAAVDHDFGHAVVADEGLDRP